MTTSHARARRGERLPVVLLALFLTLYCSCADTTPEAAQAPTPAAPEKTTPGQKVADGRAVVAAPGKYSIDIAWKKGDRFEYELVKTKKQVRDGAVKLDLTSRTPLTVEVREETKEGYLLACTYGATAFDDPNAMANPLVRKMADVLVGKPLLVEVHKGGVVSGLRNWQEIKKVYELFTATITEELKRNGADQQMIDGIVGMMGKMSTQELITQAATKEIALMLIPVGKDYEGSNPTEEDDLLQHPLGGDPLPAKVRLTLLGFTEAPKAAIVAWSQSVDLKAMGRVVEGIAKDTSNRVGKPMPDGAIPELTQMESSAEFAVDAESGWVLNLSFVRSFALGRGAESASQTETTSLRRK
jgi:hypothetical protein